MRSVNAFCKRNRVGPFNPLKNGHNNGRTSYVEQRTAYLRERTETERLRKIQLEIETGLQLGKLWLDDDVRSLFGQPAGSVRATCEGFCDRLYRDVPEARPSEDAWPEIRQCILNLADRLNAMIADAVRQIEFDDRKVTLGVMINQAKDQVTVLLSIAARIDALFTPARFEPGKSHGWVTAVFESRDVFQRVGGCALRSFRRLSGASGDRTDAQQPGATRSASLARPRGSSCWRLIDRTW